MTYMSSDGHEAPTSLMRIAYLDCFSGMSGDMFLGALMDAGVPVRLLEETVAAMNIEARIEVTRVIRSGISRCQSGCIHSRKRKGSARANSIWHSILIRMNTNINMGTDTHGQEHGHLFSW